MKRKLLVLECQECGRQFLCRSTTRDPHCIRCGGSAVDLATLRRLPMCVGVPTKAED